MILFRILKRERTEHCKELRRKYGDYSKKVHFADKKMTIGSEVMNTITTLANKDNLVFEIWT